MITIIGRGGNQKTPITEPSVANIHCLIEPLKNGEYLVRPLNVKPTYLDGDRIFSNMYVDKDAVLKIGNMSATVEEWLPTFDIGEITDWGMAAERFKSINAILSFGLYPANVYDNANKLIFCNINGCYAYYHIVEGSLREAQSIIYEAGDELYGLQDGSEDLRNAYAAFQVLLAFLYKKAGKEDAKAISLDAAMKMNADRVCSPFVINILNSL